LLASARCDVRRVAAVFVGADGTEKALFRHLLLQIGGANIENPPTSSSLADDEACLLPPPQHGGARFSDARSWFPSGCLPFFRQRVVGDSVQSGMQLRTEEG